MTTATRRARVTQEDIAKARATLEPVKTMRQSERTGGSHFFAEIPLPPDLVAYPGETAEIIDGWVVVRRIFWDQATTDKEGLRRIPTGMVRLGTVEAFIGRYPEFFARFRGLAKLSNATIPDSVSGENNEGITGRPATSGIVATRRGRRTKEVPARLLVQMAEAGYGARRAHRELKARGIDVSLRTVYTRLSALTEAA